MKYFYLFLVFLLPSLSFGLTLTQTADVVEITPVSTGNYIRYWLDPASVSVFSVQMNGTGIQQALFDDIAWSKLTIGVTYWFAEFDDSNPACTSFTSCLSDPNYITSYPSFLMTNGAVIEPTPAGTALAISSIGTSFVSAFFDYAVALMTNAMFASVMIALIVLFFGKSLVLRYISWKDRRENPYS